MRDIHAKKTAYNKNSWVAVAVEATTLHRIPGHIAHLPLARHALPQTLRALNTKSSTRSRGLESVMYADSPSSIFIGTLTILHGRDLHLAKIRSSPPALCGMDPKYSSPNTERFGVGDVSRFTDKFRTENIDLTISRPFDVDVSCFAKIPQS
jgi:hypothetical protein